MTLIAAMQMRGQPVLIGDLLISSEHPEATQIELPTLGALPKDFRPDNIHAFSNLAQKLTLINDHLVVAWSGRVVHARDFIRELRTEQKRICGAADLRDSWRTFEGVYLLIARLSAHWMRDQISA